MSNFLESEWRPQRPYATPQIIPRVAERGDFRESQPQRTRPKAGGKSQGRNLQESKIHIQAMRIFDQADRRTIPSTGLPLAEPTQAEHAEQYVRRLLLLRMHGMRDAAHRALDDFFDTFNELFQQVNNSYEDKNAREIAKKSG